MSVFYSFYQLHSFTDLNAKANRSVRQGALLKLQLSSEISGFADLHPWPELGDPDVMTCLKNKNYLFQRAIELAEWDGQARQQQRFLTAKALKSHRLILGPFQPNKSASDNEIFKLKCGPDLKMETERLKKIVDQLTGQQKLRLDFNESLEAADFDSWLSKQSHWLLSRLDFIEDPSAFDPIVFSQWQDVIAYDRVLPPIDQSIAVKVVKPVRENIETSLHFLSGHIRRVVFTHNMDHPLGQRAARAWACQFYERYPQYAEPGGLDRFDGYHLRDETITQPHDNETGLGFNSYLAEQKWQAL